MLASFIGQGMALIVVGCLCLPAFGASHSGKSNNSVETHLSRQNKTMNTIYQLGKPTGRAAYFLGRQPWLTYWRSRPVNRSDVRFGHYLMQVYSMYCDLKGLKNQCLSNGLKVFFKISGHSRSRSSLYVKVNGRTKVSNSFQEIRSFLFGEFERYGGRTLITTVLRDKIQPSPRTVLRTRFLVHLRSNGSGNAQWKGHGFRRAMLRQSEAALGKMFHIWQKGSQNIKNNPLYNRSQRQLLNTYQGLRASHAITAAISRPSANDSGGVAWNNRPQRPFVMKSCKAMHKRNYSQAMDARCTARGIYLHEMAHVFGLHHCKTHPDKQSSLCTENFWKRRDGRRWLRNQIANKTRALSVSYAY